MNQDMIVHDRLAYRPREAAEALGISAPTMYRWMAQEGFPTMRVGGCTLIPIAELQNWMAERIVKKGEM